MDLSALTLDQFLCSGALTRAPADPNSFHTVGILVTDDRKVAHLKSLGGGYEIFLIEAEQPSVALYLEDKLVGFYLDEVVAVDPDHSERELGTALVLATVPLRDLPKKRTLSEAGEKTLTAAWEVANGQREHRWPWP